MTTGSTSTSTTTFFFTLKYRDARRAHTWLADAFGFEPGAVYPDAGDRVDHAEMYVGSGGIMFGSAAGANGTNDADTPSDDYVDRTGVYAVIDNAAIDAHYARAQAAGARITRPLQDTDYGSREYTALDFEGNPWSFGTYLPTRPGAAG